MGKVYRVAIYSLAVVGLLYVLLLVAVSAGPMSGCEVVETRRAVSPDDHFDARLRVKRCRDEVSPMLELSVAKSASPDRSHAVVLGKATTTDVDLTWLSGTALQLAHSSAFRPTQMPTDLDGVRLQFVAKASPVASGADTVRGVD